MTFDIDSKGQGACQPRLTNEQQQVVAHQQGHARIIAVAGAGKTTTLVEFVKARIEAGAAARRFLILMYNKAAQLDFQAKLNKSMSGMVTIPDVRTFHSLGWRLYRSMIERGFLAPVEGTPLSDRDIEFSVWKLLQQLADDDTRADILAQRRKWVEPAVNFIERVKSGLDSPQQVFEALELPNECRLYIDLFEQFEAWRQQQQRITYSDMIYDPVRCLINNEQAKAVFAEHMDWLLVDEYQDVNAIQHALIKILCGQRGSVVVIGDPDQTIYEFRGSRPEFIVEQFSQDFPAVTDYRLSHSFRYGDALALPANQLIQHNKQRVPLFAIAHNRQQKTTVNWIRSESAARELLARLEPYIKADRLAEVAILHRLWSQSAAIELTLLAHQIPYQLDHAQSVLNRHELQLFWLLLDIGAGKFAQQTQAQRRAGWQLLLTQPFPKIKREVLNDLAEQLQFYGENLGQALQRAIPEKLTQWQKQQLQTRAELLTELELSNQSSGRLLWDYIEQTEYQNGLADTAFSSQQVDEQWQMTEALLNFLVRLNKDCVATVDYLDDLRQRHQEMQQVLLSGHGQSHQATAQAPSNRILLTSIHKSKGREWPVVILPDVDPRYYPYQTDQEVASADNIESERRLMYVAMTRAKSHLIGLLPADKKPSTGANKAGAGGASYKARHNAKQHSNHGQINIIDSPFIAEMVLPACEAVANKLAEEYAGSTKLADEKLTIDALPQQQLGLLMRYLEQIGSALQLTVKLPPNMAQMDQSGPVLNNTDGRSEQSGRVIEKRSDWLKVEHKSLGAGVLVKADGDYLTIQFNGEKGLRTFRRDIVEPLLTMLDRH